MERIKKTDNQLSKQSQQLQVGLDNLLSTRVNCTFRITHDKQDRRHPQIYIEYTSLSYPTPPCDIRYRQDLYDFHPI